MLSEDEIKLKIENWLYNKPITIESIKSLIQHYIKDRTDKEVDFTVSHSNLMKYAMNSIIEYYSVKLGRTIVTKESKILKIQWA